MRAKPLSALLPIVFSALLLGGAGACAAAAATAPREPSAAAHSTNVHSLRGLGSPAGTSASGMEAPGMQGPSMGMDAPAMGSSMDAPVGASMGMGSSMAGASAAAPIDPARLAFFEKSIRPLLSQRCYPCHSGALPKPAGGLVLDSRQGWQTGGGRGPAVIPGKPDASLLLRAVSYTDASLSMPPGGKLSDAQISALRQWIAMGAPDPRDGAPVKGRLSGLTAKARAHWAFQPIRAQAVPVFKNNPWVKTPVDAFILARLHAHGMHPNPPASREVLIRRATYDLIGLPPTVAEVRAFLADRSPGAFARVVDRLLASAHYGERWGRHWLDTARYSDTTGNTGGGSGRFADYRYPYAWAYRDYVIQSMNEDKPYNQFLLEQIAADRLPDIKPNDPRLAALGFLTVGKRFDNPDDTIDERIDTLTKATLGLTVACARCHDHKFDPVPTADYYSLHGIFASSFEPNDPPELPGTGDSSQRREFESRLADLETKNRDLFYQTIRERLAQFQPNAEGYLLMVTQRYNSPERYDIGKQYNLLPENHEITSAIPNRPDNPVLGPFFRLSRIPADHFAVQAAALIPRLITDRRLNPLVASVLRGLRPSSLDDVARAYAGLFAEAGKLTNGYLQAQSTLGAPPPAVPAAMAQLIETPYAIPAAAAVSTPEDLRLAYKKMPLDNQTINKLYFAAINELRLTEPGAPACAMVMYDSPKPVDSYIHIRGDRARRGPVVPRQFLEILSGPNRKPFTDGSGRLELAKAIINPSNPLTARVLVNRAWMYHFGQGFVPTPDDLGNQSEPPSHPELLDWLSNWFMKNGWSLKKLHRLIMLSSVYQESSDPQPVNTARDPGNRLLSRANIRRLDFEAIRDSMVMLTGKMDETIGGKPVNITDEPYSYRRSVYGYVDRLNLSDLMTQFDFSEPDQANTRRISTIVPQQALFFMNSPMSVDVARQVVVRPEVDTAVDDPAEVRAIYLNLFQRSPTPREVSLALNFVAAAARMPGSESASKPGAPARQNTSVRPAALRSPGAPPRVAPRTAPRTAPINNNRYAIIQNPGNRVTRAPLTPWELYTQALICTNEFVYVK